MSNRSEPKRNDNGGWVIGKDNAERLIDAERIILAIGCSVDRSLYDQIKSLGYEVHQIGDCVEPRNAKAAIFEGAVLGRLI